MLRVGERGINGHVEVAGHAVAAVAQVVSRFRNAQYRFRAVKPGGLVKTIHVDIVGDHIGADVSKYLRRKI